MVGTTHLKAKEEFAAIRAEQGRDLVTWLKSIAAGECCLGSIRAVTLSPGSRALLQVSDAEGPAGP